MVGKNSYNKDKVNITRRTRTENKGADGHLNTHEKRPHDYERGISNPFNQCGDDNHWVDSLGTEIPESAGFEYFKICVNGEIVDSEISLDIRSKYHQLCCDLKTVLHDRVKDLNTMSVVAMIVETVNIADSTKATSLSTPLPDLELMDKILKSYEDLGMTVKSLRAKIWELIKILRTHQSVTESKRAELEKVESERTSLWAKIEELMGSAITDGEFIGRLEGRIDALQKRKESLGLILNKTRMLPGVTL